MFNWKDFFEMVIIAAILLLLVGLIAGGFYMMCEMGNAWGYALVVCGVVLGGGVAAGFGL